MGLGVAVDLAIDRGIFIGANIAISFSELFFGRW